MVTVDFAEYAGFAKMPGAMRGPALGLFLWLAACEPRPALPEGGRAPDAEPTARLHLIDVGQGAATLFELPCGTVLIDTGGEEGDGFDSSRALGEYLERFFARRADLHRTIDLLVLTHPHLDHTHNARLVAEGYTVKGVVTDGRATGSGSKQQHWLEEWAGRSARLETVTAERIAPGGMTDDVIDPLRCSGVDPGLRVLWGGVDAKPNGWSDKAFHNENNHSVVVRLDFGRASFLVSGDLEEAGIGALLAKHAGTGALDVDVWEVSHHGSYNGTTKELLDALTPHVALIAMGPPDRPGRWTAWGFGHPRKRAIDMLAASVDRGRPAALVHIGTAMREFQDYRVERAIYATGWDGNVVVSATAGGEYRVETSRKLHE